ncbi:MAG: exopolysaccharide biosynthesis polyprenyl glycosylphosphotransferase [Planctomycetota bacterium]|nr:exopolysaccharide biosynthesis polyprenyl glycosylphosphotransferase [Planctomycetota bacterium]
MTDTPSNGEDPRSAHGPGRGRLLLIGGRRRVRHLARCLDQGRFSGVPVVGFVDLSGRGRQLVVHPRSEPVPILGTVANLAEVVDRSRATDLVVALSGRPARRIRPQLSDLSNSSADVRIHWVEDVLAAPGDDAIFLGDPLWTVHRRSLPERFGRFGKRLVDIVGAAIGLLLLTPLFLVVAALILVTSGRPVFYTQDRIGQGGRRFRIVKFRSMRLDAETQTGPIWAEDHDKRCTKIGDWLRHSNIDELPQLINVLTGDMSLVGPRPERPMFVDKFLSEVPDYEYRHAVPVGMTGWAQVHGWRGRTSLRKRVQYDLDYIGRWSFWLDLRILLMTVQHVVYGKISWTATPKRKAP